MKRSVFHGTYSSISREELKVLYQTRTNQR
uniref:Uncharacterized protein n=1 Tax=Arundo donax TaxID=35708 RepID=A0A0A8XP29_ARUDO